MVVILTPSYQTDVALLTLNDRKNSKLQPSAFLIQHPSHSQLHELFVLGVLDGCHIGRIDWIVPVTATPLGGSSHLVSS